MIDGQPQAVEVIDWAENGWGTRIFGARNRGVWISHFEINEGIDAGEIDLIRNGVKRPVNAGTPWHQSAPTPPRPGSHRGRFEQYADKIEPYDRFTTKMSKAKVDGALTGLAIGAVLGFIAWAVLAWVVLL